MPGTHPSSLEYLLSQKSILCFHNICVENLLCAIFLVLEIQWRTHKQSEVCGVCIAVEERLGGECINEYHDHKRRG